MKTAPFSNGLPPTYMVMFLIVEPSVIFISLIALVLSPTNFFDSLAPEESSGALFRKNSSIDTCGASESWNTPQLRVLHYQFMAALGFSAIIEPSLLFVALYRVSNSKDAERVIQAVLISFLAFDLLHALATATVVGSSAILPIDGWSNVSTYACINVWVPVTWMVIRACWFAGIGRGDSVQLKRD